MQFDNEGNGERNILDADEFFEREELLRELVEEDDDERAAWDDEMDEGDGYGGREDAYLDIYMESMLMGEL